VWCYRFEPGWRGLNCALLVLLCPLPGQTQITPDPSAKPAEIEVSGYGFWRNRELKKIIRLLGNAQTRPPFYEASFIEDAALALILRLKNDGFLHPGVHAEVISITGETERFEWHDASAPVLPRPLQARKVTFELKPGILFFYKELAIDGLEDFDPEKARSFFVGAEFLVSQKRAKIYTPGRLKRGARSLREALARLGYEEALVEARVVDEDPADGEIRATVSVVRGKRTFVSHLSEKIHGVDGTTSLRVMETNFPFSQVWLQDYIQGLKNEQYRHGFADATVEVARVKREELEDRRIVEFVADIRPGLAIQMGRIVLEGNEKTSSRMLRQRLRLDEGQLLDRVEVDKARQRLMRLGVFESVDLRYEPVDETTRDVAFRFREGKELDFSLLFGYGSYELLRGGIELDQYNLFGLAHQARLRLSQSFKATSADYLYTIPQITGQDINLFFNAFGFRREEISFTREEYGGSLGIERFLAPIQSDVSLRYNYQVLNALQTEVDRRVGLEQASVGAWLVDIKHDQRNNPLYPTKGFKLFTSLEFASASLGGDVDYQRFEAGGSYHHLLGGGRVLHLGTIHGVEVTQTSSARDLPFNKRFFPGGENSVRGYQQGEAAPRNDRGRLVGAESYLQLNLELEQPLTDKWAVVGFLDAIGVARDLANYPFNRSLFSAGLGIRWRTIIGPARLEYGHNLNPRAKDPPGTLHFSVGFPF